MKRIEVEKMTEILKVIYKESQNPEQKSQVVIAKECGVSQPTVNKVFNLLKDEKILFTTGTRKTFSYSWKSTRVPSEALALKLNAVQVKENKISDFVDSELISELKNRGYVIFKEC